MKIKLLLFLFVAYACFGTLPAQVTIGSNLKPNDGALLDIKESQTSDGTFNTRRGVNMPRVALTDKGKLQPMYGYTGVDDTPAEAVLKEHTGLMVYNTTEDANFCPGIYIWKGKEWVTLYNIPFKPDLTVYDTDGNSYMARWYVHDQCSPTGGAYWLTTNLRTTKTTTGGTFSGGVRMNPAKWGSQTGAITVNSRTDLQGSAKISYKENGISMSEDYSTFATKFGLLYKWQQAEVACPQGWRLATNTDWNNLFVAIGAGTADKGKRLMGNDWTYQANDRSTPFPNGGGFPPSDARNSGFWGVPTGAVHGNGIAAEKFSEQCFWWSQSEAGEHIIWYLNWEPAIFGSDDASVFVNYYFPVRCVRNEI